MNFACWLADYDLYDKHSYSVLTLFLTCTCSREPPTPSILGKRRRKTVAAKSSQDYIVGQGSSVFATILYGFVWFGGVLPVSRKKKDILALFGLVGKVHLESDWTAAEVVAEMKSTFSEVLQGEDCTFKFLQFTRAGTKSLIVPKVSPSYQWTPKEVAGRADRPVYLLLQKNLDNEV